MLVHLQDSIYCSPKIIFFFLSLVLYYLPLIADAILVLSQSSNMQYYDSILIIREVREKEKPANGQTHAGRLWQEALTG